MSKKYTIEEAAKLIAKEIRKATEEFEKAEVVFEERFSNKEMQVERQGELSDCEPKVGDLGYFWNDDYEFAIFGILSNINGDEYKYWLDFASYRNFSKEPPIHLFEKKEEVKKVGYESITNWLDINYGLNEAQEGFIDCYRKILPIVKTINNLDPKKSDTNTDYYEIYPSKIDELMVGWCSVKKPTSFYSEEAAEHALKYMGDIWRGFYGLKRENEE